MGVFEKIQNMKKGYQENFRQNRNKKFEALKLESKRIEKEAKIKNEYENARAKLSKAKAKEMNRKFGFVKDIAKNAKTARKRIENKAKKSDGINSISVFDIGPDKKKEKPKTTKKIIIQI